MTIMRRGRHVPAAAGLAVSAVVLAAAPALAHEAWLLSPLERVSLAATPLSDVWRGLGWAAAGIGLALLLAIALAEALDRHLQPFEQRVDRRYQASLRHFGLLVLRVTLGALMIAAALGFSPRVGTPLFAEPTLFVPDLQLARVTDFAAPVAGLQLLAGAALVLGIYVNIASLITMGLVAAGFAWFGPQVMLNYAGHVLAPAFVLLIEDRDRFEHVNPRDAAPERLAQRLLPFMTLERSLIVLRVVTGATFMYLAFMDKFLHSPQLERIIAEQGMPTFGIDPETLVFLMSAVEFAGGFALVAGIAERIVAVALIGAMLFFHLVLAEPPLVHVNIFGILIAIVLLGPGYLSAQGLAPGHQRRGFALFRVGLAAVLCVVIATAGAWVSRVRPAIAFDDARLVRVADGARPELRGAVVEPLGGGFLRLSLDVAGFSFGHGGDGHAHLYADGERLATVMQPEAVVGPVPPGTAEIVVTLMDHRHRYLVDTDGALFARTIPLADPVARAD